MFSKELPEILRYIKTLDEIPRLAGNAVRELLERCTHREVLPLHEITQLVCSAADPANQRLIKEFSASCKRPLDRKVLLLPPLYIDSSCENRCRYCNFRRMDGERLTYEEFADEFERLLEIGYRSIEIVSSQDPELFIHKQGFDLADQTYSIERLTRYFEIARAKFGNEGKKMLTSNIPPLDVDSLKHLRAAGLDCFLVWAETFDSDQYKVLHHDASPKGDQYFRLDSYERAILAGIDHVAGAFLKGLYDWRREEIVLYCLESYLKRLRGAGFSIIGTPRVKGSFQKSKVFRQYRVSDDEYELNIALDRILFDGLLWLQTRESFSTNKQLIFKYGGGVILTIDSCTAPGGYKQTPKGKTQFPVHKAEREKALRELEHGGFEPVFDWDSRTLSDMIRS